MSTETRSGLLLSAILLAPLILIVLSAWLIPPPLKEPAQTRIDPGIAYHFPQGQTGHIDLTGEGIPPDLRVSITHDTDNRSAITGWLELPGNAQRLTIDGNLGYLASGLGGLHILDLGDPKAPHVIGSAASAGLAWDLIVRDKIVFLSANGLQVIDVSQPSAPYTLATLNLPKIKLLDLAISGNTLYAGSTTGLQIFDISQPTAPRHVTSIPFSGGPWALAIKDNLLLLSVREYSHEYLEIFDISAPHSPQLLSKSFLHSQVWDIATYDHYAYLSLGTLGIRSYNIAKPNDPQSVDLNINSRPAHFITIDGNRAYATSRHGAFNIFEIESPTDFRPIGAVTLPPQTRPVVLLNGYAFVANGQSGLLSIDVKSPRLLEHPQVLSEPGMVTAVLKFNDSLYLASKNSGLYIARRDKHSRAIDILAHLPVKGGLNALSRIGNLLCAVVANGNHALLIDISDPLSPLIVGTITGDAPFRDTTANDRYFFLAEETGRILMVDAHTPAAPITYNLASIHAPLLLLARNDRLFVIAKSTKLLTVIAVDTPARTPSLAQFEFPWPISDVISIHSATLTDKWLVLSTGDSGLLAFDLESDMPHIISGIDLGEKTSAVTYSDGKIYASTGTGKLWVLRRQGNHLEKVAATGTMGKASTILVDGEDALLAIGSKGLAITPLPKKVDIDVRKAGKHLQVTLPASLSPGDYRLELLYNKHLFPYAPVRIEPPQQGQKE